MEENTNYLQAIAQAENAIADIKARGSDAIGGNVLEFMDSLLTPKEIAESNLRVSLMENLIEARQKKRLTQAQFEELIEVI